MIKHLQNDILKIDKKRFDKKMQALFEHSFLLFGVRWKLMQYPAYSYMKGGTLLTYFIFEPLRWDGSQLRPSGYEVWVSAS